MKIVALDAVNIRPGGGLVVVQGVIHALLSAGYGVHVYAASSDTYEMLQNEFASTIQMSKLNVESLFGRTAFRFFLYPFLCLLRKHALSFSLNGHFFSFVPTVVYHVNVLRFEGEKNGLISRLQSLETRIALSRSKANLFESKEVFRIARNTRWTILNSRTCYFGAEVPDEPICTSAPKRAQVITVTSPQAHKRNELVVKALKRVRAAGYDVSLVVAGGHSNADWGDLKSTIDECELADNVKFLGYLDRRQLREVYKNSVCLVSASEKESFCMVALEAMADALPVVVMNVSAMPESVGGAGVVVPDGDADAMGDAVIELLSSDSWCARSIASRRWALNFSRESFSRDFVSIIENLVGNNA